MDAEVITKEAYEDLVAALSELPVGRLPPLLVPSAGCLTTEWDIRLVADGMALGRQLLVAKARQREEEHVLATLSQAKAREIPPQSASRVTRAIEDHPELLARIPLSDDDIQAYMANFRPVLSAVVCAIKDPAEADRVIRGSIVQPMNVMEHSFLVTLMMGRIKDVSADTLFKYLDAVEASCRVQLPKDTLVHNVRLASKALSSAMDVDETVALTMAIELNSFCLSYPWVKDAADLYKRALAIQRNDDTQ
ncbi:hypothetical protein GQ54DRAFT_310037 [Martensiomyces pterosporus]|nr:hypothetical protein GQ54DRAFT_310037 [Martensiomyces pterosporus]